MFGEPRAESWRVGEGPHQVSRTHQHRGARCRVENSSHLMMGLTQYHYPAVQLGEDFLG